MSTTTTVTVTGMTCGHCVSAVSSELSKLTGVTGVDIDLTSGLVEITSEISLERSAVDAAVDEAGYDVTP